MPTRRRMPGSCASNPHRSKYGSPVPNVESIPRLFGTDGVRGTAGKYPLDPPTVRRLGAALVREWRANHGAAGSAARPRILVGRDTRESGGWIEAELAHGASGEGASVTSAGVVPTPAVAYLTRTEAYEAGVVISASHNPFEDNGIKVFSGKGEKFTERDELAVEAILADTSWHARSGEAGAVKAVDLVGPYLEHLRAAFPESGRLQGFLVAIDCANGAATTVAPQLLDRKSTRLNSSHLGISYAVFCLKKNT